MKLKNFLKNDKNYFNDDEVVIIKNGIITENMIKNSKKVLFVIASKDEKVIEKSQQAIIDYQQEHQNQKITVLVSSSYEKLHKITHGLV